MKNSTILKLILTISVFCMYFFIGTSIAENANMTLESDKYLILEEKEYIARIMPETKIDILKENFNMSSSAVHIYKDKTLAQEVTTGYATTGMILKCDGIDKAYELSVVGDINKDGIINQIDLNLLIKHVVGLKQNKLQGVEENSADLSKDGKLDQVDITILIRYIVYHELYVPEIKRPGAPTIEVVSGTAENDWYSTDVSLKVKQSTKTDVEIAKTVYKVSGTKNVAETIIDKEATIKLTEGEYKITAYSYAKDGAKSAVTTKTIKIDKTAPNGTLDTKVGSYSIMTTVEVEDNLSGVKDYTYYIGKTIDGTEEIEWEKEITSKEATYVFENLSCSTKYYIKVEVQDNVGNIKTLQSEYSTLEHSETKDIITITQNNKKWTNENVVVTVSAKDTTYTTQYSEDGKTWNDFKTKKDITVEENKTIYARITRWDDTVEAIALKVENIDKVAPEVNIEGYDITSRSLKTKLNVKDEISGIAKLIWHYKPVGSETFTNEQYDYLVVGSSQKGETELQKNEEYQNLTSGTYYVCAEVTDVAGNTTVSETVAIDTLDVTNVKDGINFTLSNENWTNQNLTATLASKDANYTILSSLDGEEWTNITSYDVSENDTIYAKLTDGINNGDVHEFKVENIDKVSSQIQIEAKEITSKTVKISAHVLDEASGLASIKWYYKNVNDENYIEQKVDEYQTIHSKEAGELDTVKEYTFENLAKGKYEIYAKAYDVAGNEVTSEVLTVELETVASAEDKLSFTKNNENWTNKPVTVTVTNSDERYDVEVSSDGTNWTKASKITLEQNGTVHARLTDGINVGLEKTEEITNIDVTNIECTLSSKNITSKGFTVQADVQDNSSGIAKIDWYLRKQGTEEYNKQTTTYKEVGSHEAGDITASKEITYDNLENWWYEVYTEITDVAGNVTKTPVMTVELVRIVPGETGIDVELNTENWTNQDVEITATSKDIRYTVQVSQDGTNWEDTNTFTFMENAKYYLRLTDGINYGDIVEKEITNIDKQKATISASITNVTSRSFMVNVTGSDDKQEENSGFGTIEIYYKKSTDTKYKVQRNEYKPINGNIQGGISIRNEYLVDGLEKDTYQVYVVATDVAGNVTTTEGEISEATLQTVTSAETGLILEANNTNWTNAPVTVTATSQDERYTEQTSLDSKKWKDEASVTISKNETVHARLTDGVNVGEAKSVTITNIDTTLSTGEVVCTSKDTKTINIKITAQDEASGVAKVVLYYQKDSEAVKSKEINTYVTINGAVAGRGSIEEYVTIENLLKGTYTVYAEITDTAGNVTTTESISVTLDTVTSAKTAITLTPNILYWTNTDIKVTATSTDSRYTIETSTNATDWTEDKIVTIADNKTTVYARLSDGVNAGEYTSYTIANIDKKPIRVGAIENTPGGTTLNLRLDVTDEESVSGRADRSGVAKVIWYYKESSEAEYNRLENTYADLNGDTAGNINTTLTKTIDGLIAGKTYNVYAEVFDVAGNKSTTEVANALTNRAPINLTATYKSKTTGSITISAKATDPDGNNLTYTLYTSTSKDGTYTNQGSKTASTGTQVDLTTKVGLSEYTSYYYYVEVSDGIATVETVKGSNAKTKCSGTTYTCTTSRCSGGDYYPCSQCDGTGKIECDLCNGTGRMPCPGPLELTETVTVSCSCGGTYEESYYECSTCGLSRYCRSGTCSSCGRGGSNTMNEHNSSRVTCTGGKSYTCTSCHGAGGWTDYCSHDLYNSHRYCGHYDNISATSHKYCAHNYNGVEHE